VWFRRKRLAKTKVGLIGLGKGKLRVRWSRDWELFSCLLRPLFQCLGKAREMQKEF
jgi:hypothetical protein